MGLQLEIELLQTLQWTVFQICSVYQIDLHIDGFFSHFYPVVLLILRLLLIFLLKSCEFGFIFMLVIYYWCLFIYNYTDTWIFKHYQGLRPWVIWELKTVNKLSTLNRLGEVILQLRITFNIFITLFFFNCDLSYVILSFLL